MFIELWARESGSTEEYRRFVNANHIVEVLLDIPTGMTAIVISDGRRLLVQENEIEVLKSVKKATDGGGGWIFGIGGTVSFEW